MIFAVRGLYWIILPSVDEGLNLCLGMAWEASHIRPAMIIIRIHGRSIQKTRPTSGSSELDFFSLGNGTSEYK